MTDVPSNPELADAVNDILRNHDLEKITLRIVMTMLCEKFAVTSAQLAPHKRFVRSTINDFLEKTYVPVDNAAPDDPADPPRTSVKRKADDQPAAANGAHAAADPASNANGQSPAAAAAAAAAAAEAIANLKPIKLTGLERAVVLAQPLADFIGEVVIPRSHIPKRISAYAKQHNLQDPADGRRINCDEALKEALKVDNFTFFTLSKIVSGLVYKPEECQTELQELARVCEERHIAEKQKKREQDIVNGVPQKKKPSRATKKQKTAAAAGAPDKPRKLSGLFKPMELSEALKAVVGESPLSRSDVLKKIWHYIRENGLKDPNDGKRVLCDAKLRAVFEGADFVNNMGINGYLSAHMTKIE